jgi:GDP-L-fucose synthase
MAKRIFISGASGFIGRNLKEHLQSVGGYKVLAPGYAELDMLDSEAVKSYIEHNDIDIIFHGANIGGSRKSSHDRVMPADLRMFFNLTRCRGSFDRMISCGSGAEYDKRSPITKATETDFGKRVPVDDYGFSKYIMSTYAAETDNISVIRFFAVFGKYEDYEFRFISNAIVKNLLSMPITIKQNVLFDFLYIDDCVRLIERMLRKKPKHSSYNLARGESVNILSLAGMINEHSSYKSKITVENPGMNNEYTADNSRLVSEYGKDFKFTPFDESIPALIGYYRSILPTIDTEKIRQDPYLSKCTVKGQ